jgi:integrase
MPKLDTSHLEFVGRSYRCQLAIPRHLHSIMGKAKLVRSLKTDSLSTASIRKLPVLHDFRQQIAEAEHKHRGQGGSDPIMAEAMEWRVVAHEDFASTALEARYEELVKTEGTARADAMVEVATGRHTPLQTLLDDWLAERGMKPRQVLDYRRAATKLATWLTANGHPPTIEAVTKRTASDYRMAAFVRAGVNPKTANKDISALSSLWKFAERRSLVEDSPWRGQSLPKAKARAATKRPYTDAELATILHSDHLKGLLRDAVTILSLTGMRTEELARMVVGDIKLGPTPLIQLRGTKTDAAARQVPIHASLLKILEARSVGKAKGDYLLHELPTPPEGSAMERGQPLTKAFGRLRDRLGLGAKELGARQANLDLHGLRRWAAASMRDALNRGTTGFSMRTVAQVLGHDTGGLGFSMTSMYAGEEPLEAKAAAIGALRLP